MSNLRNKIVRILINFHLDDGKDFSDAQFYAQLETDSYRWMPKTWKVLEDNGITNDDIIQLIKDEEPT
jgi:hypothetical protein